MDEEAIEIELPSRQNVEKKLADLAIFMATGLYSSIQATIKYDLAKVEESILLTPPDTESNRSASLNLFGRREELLRFVTFFEETRDRLNELLSEIIEKEAQQVPDNTETNE